MAVTVVDGDPVHYQAEGVEVGTIVSVHTVDDQSEVQYQRPDGEIGRFLSWVPNEFREQMVVVVTPEVSGDMPQSFKG